MTDLSILIVDDHTLFRTGLNMILKQEEHIATVLEAGSVMETLQHAQFKIDLILSDIQMPGLNGLEGIKVLKEQFPQTPIIILSASVAKEDIEEAREAGADGFLPKSSSAKLIIEAISSALGGIHCFPQDSESTHSTRNAELPIDLTSRQLQVLSLLCEGKPNKLIARELELSENTVRVHVSAILAILNVPSRSKAILVAQQQKLIRPQS